MFKFFENTITYCLYLVSLKEPMSKYKEDWDIFWET